MLDVDGDLRFMAIYVSILHNYVQLNSAYIQSIEFAVFFINNILEILNAGYQLRP